MQATSNRVAFFVALIMAVTLQNCLDYASYLIGESGTPTSEVTKRTLFANGAKNAIARIRPWSWELQDGDAINFVYSSSPVNGIYTYSLTPSAGNFKNKDAMYLLKFTDQNGTISYFSPVDESTMDYDTKNGRTDNVFLVKGNDKAGYTLVVNAGASALPTQNVTGAWTYRYFYKDPDFVNTTDTTAIPSSKIIAEYIAAEILYGYREQAEYELARQRYQGSLEDLAMQDMKLAPFQESALMTLRQSKGESVNFKTYY